MSGFALPALGLAQRAVTALPALFADLARRSPPEQIARLDSTGFRVEGQGAARYICDSLCDQTLLGAHPRFVFRTPSTRFRSTES